jgi:hypothetical protein
MEARSDIQLEILSPTARDLVIISPSGDSKQVKRLSLLLLLSVLYTIIHLYFQSIYIQETGIFFSILFELASSLLLFRKPSKKYSFGWGRSKSLSSLFSAILLIFLMINDLHLELIIRPSESSIVLHSIVLLINLFQLLIYVKFSGLIKIFLMWSSVSHVLCLCPLNIRLYLVVLESLIICALALLETKDSIMELMEFSNDESGNELERRIKALEGVCDVHNFHQWAVGKTMNLSFHVKATDPSVLKGIRSFCNLSGYPNATIQFELPSFHCKSYNFIN